jgi:hypothetical protein
MKYQIHNNHYRNNRAQAFMEGAISMGIAAIVAVATIYLIKQATPEPARPAGMGPRVAEVQVFEF